MNRFTAKLNPQQARAVEITRGPLLVLAGAGSGKTRILTHRICYLIESGQALPGEICALTFTNKAARVMRDRVEDLLVDSGVPVQEMLLCTFHSLGAKLLRQYGSSIGIEAGFTIFDDSDQISVIKEVMETLGVNDKVVAPKAIMHRINELKNDAIDPREFIPAANSYMESKMAPVIRGYEEALRKNNAVDFGDLILKTYKLFKEDEIFRDGFQERYKFVLVDEYQDTNASQYKLLRLMTEKYRNLCVVGDEDQSIYGWRGADIRNILDFEKDFPESQIVKLEQNYRSTGHIISAANKVIQNNRSRKEKTLFTERGQGEPIEVHALESDFDEAKFIGEKIKELTERGLSLKDIAIFYRTNAQSRMLEDRLRYDRFPYRIFGGLKFYDRAEVKDALSYLRLFVNPRDEVSLNRIINVPARGIGRSSMDQVREWSRTERLPLLESLGMLSKGEGNLGTGPKKKIILFLDLYARLLAKLDTMKPVEFYAYMLDETGYLKMLQAENNEEAVSRIENLNELGTVISEYEARNPEPSIVGFLEEISLMSDLDQNVDDPNFVSMMTVHMSKGMEFPAVFLTGMEEELFPHIRADMYGETNKDDLEEERRLCYVGITRGEDRLFLTAAKMRRVFGISHVRNLSRFIAELPQHEIAMIDHAPRQSTPRASSFKSEAMEEGFGSGFQDDLGYEVPAKDGYGVGVRVSHPDFGVGAVIAREGQAEGLKVTVKFSRVGVKKFVVRFAPLELLS